MGKVTTLLAIPKHSCITPKNEIHLPDRSRFDPCVIRKALMVLDLEPQWLVVTLGFPEGVFLPIPSALI